MNRYSSHSLIIRSLLIIGVAWLAFSAPLSAYAHDDEAIIELNVTQARPGASITIRGSGFEPGDATTIMLMLVSSDRPQVLGTATADDHGDLAQVVSLPADLTGGAYEVRVADAHHVATASLSIVTDSSDDDEGSQRGEDEPLLAPMPTRQTMTTSSSQTAAAPASTANAQGSSAGLLLLPIGVLVVAGIALILTKRSAR